MSIGVINPGVAAKAWGKLTSQLCILTGHENSNGVYSGYGYSYGWSTALADAGVKQYSIGLVPPSSFSSSTGVDDNGASRIAGTATPFRTIVPSSTSTGGWDFATNENDISLYANYSLLFRFGKAHNSGGGGLYMPYYAPRFWNGSTAMSIIYAAGGIEMLTSSSKPSQFDRNAELTCDFWHSPSTDNGGTFRPYSLQGSVPNVQVSWSNTDTYVAVALDGEYTYFTRITRTLAAATRDQKFRVQWAGPNASYVPTGEIGLGYIHVWETNARRGFALSPFWALGGCSTEDFAYAISRTDGEGLADETAELFITALARPAVAAGQEPYAIWVIGDTSNTASETDTSVVTAKAATSVEAYVENVSYVIDYVTARWEGLGYKRTNLVFMLRGDHPAKNAANEATQANLRASAFSALAAKYPSRVFGFVSHKLTSSAELTARNLYAGAEVDGYHLNGATGYLAYTNKLVAAWRSASGPRALHGRGRLISSAR